MIPGTFFSDATPVVELDVEMPDGNSYPMHFRRLPRARFLRYYKAIEKADEDTQDVETAKLIAESICDPDGTLSLTPERAITLTVGAAQTISNAVMRANDMARNERRAEHAKPSEPEARAGSGEFSPSRSADGRSVNGVRQ